MEKGEAIKALRQKYTLQQLEKVFPCSEKKIRDYEMFADVARADRPQLNTLGSKGLLAFGRKKKAFDRKCKRLAKGSSGRKLRIN